MPRQLRIEYEGAIYHVMNRGDHGENIFFEKSRLASSCLLSHEKSFSSGIRNPKANLSCWNEVVDGSLYTEI